MKRIKFFSVNDMLNSDNLIQIKEKIDKFDDTKNDYTINEIIEFYNITKYMDKEVYQNYFLDWLDDDILKLKNINEKYKEIISRFIKKISNDNIITMFKEVEDDAFNYEEDLFELIGKYKVYENISEDIFLKLLQTFELSCDYVLKNKNISNYFGKVIRQYLLENSESALIILDYYEVKHTGDKEKLYFPKELTKEDKEQIIINYINSDEAHLGYLRVINNIQNRDELYISDKTRLLSIKKSQSENDRLFKDNPGIEYGAEVRFSKNQEDVIKVTREKQIWKYSYDINWLYENRDYSTLLNNFIYLFGYVDRQMRITLLSKENELAMTEKHMGIKAKNEYEIGMAFNLKNILSILQITMYYKELNIINIRIEDIIEWFFNTYLSNEFNIENFLVTMPSKDSTYFEKCKSILPEIDYILKQYNLFVEDGNIDQELLEVSTTSILFENVKSLINNKYIYGNIKSPEFNSLCYYFFSSQCLLHFNKKYNSYNSLYKLLKNENVKANEYSGITRKLLNRFIEASYIYIDSDGYIRIKDPIRISIIKELYDNEFISYWKYSSRIREKIDELIKENILVTDDSLFSKQEQDYFNFFLNQRNFSNTHDLRNKYLHGNKIKKADENTHYRNYMLFLKLIILIIIKINDDLCTNEDIKRKL